MDARIIRGSRSAYGFSLVSIFLLTILASIPAVGWPQDQSGTPTTENLGAKPEQDATQKQSPVIISVTFWPNVGDYYGGEARRKRMEGLALVTICIRATGKIDSVEIKNTSGYPLLDDAALGVARAVKFRPPMQDGKPVPFCTDLPVRFNAVR